MVELKNIIINTPTETLEKILSPFIEEQFPSFVRRDYRKLVLFIKSYYEWLEAKGNPGYVLSNLGDIYDIDKSLEEYYSHFKNTYLEGFPEIFATTTGGQKPNKNTLLKHIRDFYGNKGTESAYKFLFRVLYDSDVEFYYPKEDILKTSDGRWIEKQSIKTTSVNTNIFKNATLQSVYQYIGNQLVASANIDSVVKYNQNGYEITEFFLKDLVGNFISTVPVTFIVDGQEYQESVFSVLSDFYIQTPGSNFRVGDEIYITDDKGTGFSAFIEQTGLGGSIKKIGVKNSGINYFKTVSVSFISQTGDLRSAVVFARPTAITRYPGYYSNNSGKLSSTKKIQDGHYYQDFSYELKSAVSLDTYYNVLRDLIHPSGTRMFGSILVKDILDSDPTTSAQGTIFRDPIIGNYTPYTHGTTLDLRNNGLTGGAGWCGAEGDLYPFGYNPYIGSTSEVGPSGKTAPLGTLFYGTSLGYTYCIVPEGGKTAHDPLGAPLGSTTAWFRGKETALTPEGMRGLVLWLKPENIGVCGAVVAGASVDVWRDASPSQNHAVPPTWDKWTAVSYITETTNGAGWNREARSTNPVTKIKFTGTGLCGGFTLGRLFMMGLNQDPSTSTGYDSIDYAWYRLGPHPGPVSTMTLQRASQIYESGVLKYNTTTTPYASDDTIYEMEYTEPNIVYKLNGTPIRSIYAGYGLTFYIDSSFYNAASGTTSGITGTSITLLEASFKGNPVVPSWVTSAGITAINYAGVTVDKLRPTLAINDYGVAGATGVSFGGGLIVSPKTTWNELGENYILNSSFVGSEWVMQTNTVSLISGVTGTFAPGRLDSTGVVGVKIVADPRDASVQYYNRKFLYWVLPSQYRVADKTWNTSLYIKAGNSANSTVRLYDNGLLNSAVLSITLSSGSVSISTTSSSAFYVSHRVIPVGDGWYRISLALRSLPNGNGYGAPGSRMLFLAFTDSSLSDTAWNGDGSIHCYLWGPQVEPYNYARPYVPTSGATARATALSTFDYLDSKVILPVVPGGTFESLLKAPHMYLTRPLILSKDMDAFIVFRVKNEGSTKNTGLINSSRNLNDTFFTDQSDEIIHCRGWNDVDISTTNPLTATQNYAVTGTTVRYYWNTSSLGFVPHRGYLAGNVPSTQRGAIGYDPHVSNLSVGRIIGEVARDTSNVLYMHYNGDRATNYSPTTGRAIAKYGANSVSESPTPVSGITIDIGRIGAHVFSNVTSTNPFGSTAWVSGITGGYVHAYSFNGVLNEVIVFDRKLQEEERQQVYGYLARKYKMDTKLPDSYYLAHASGYEKDLTYWGIAHHPNSKSLSTIPAGISFAGITITNFLNMPETIYKSKGTVLSDGTILSGDTYGYLGVTGA